MYASLLGSMSWNHCDKILQQVANNDLKKWACCYWKVLFIYLFADIIPEAGGTRQNDTKVPIFKDGVSDLIPLSLPPKTHLHPPALFPAHSWNFYLQIEAKEKKDSQQSSAETTFQKKKEKRIS